MSFLSDAYSKWKSVSWIWDLIALIIIGAGIAAIVKAPVLPTPIMWYMLGGFGILFTIIGHIFHIVLSEPAEEYFPINSDNERYKRYADQKEQESPPPAISMFSRVTTWQPGEGLYKAADEQLSSELNEDKDQVAIEVKQEEAPIQNPITSAAVLSARYLGVGYMFTNCYADARNTLKTPMNIPYLTLGSLSSESKHATLEEKDNPRDEERYSNCDQTVSLANNSFPREGDDPYIRPATKYDPVINFMLGQHYESVGEYAKAVSCYMTVARGFKAIDNFRHLDPINDIFGGRNFSELEARKIRIGYEITNVLAALSYIEAAMKVSCFYSRVASEAEVLRIPAEANAKQCLENATYLYNQVILELNTKLRKICSDYSYDGGVIVARYLTAEVNNFFQRVRGQKLKVGEGEESLIGLSQIPQFKAIFQGAQLTSTNNMDAPLSTSANSSSSALSFS